MQQGHFSQQGQQLEQDGPEQERSYTAQDIQAHLYPASEMGRIMYETAKPNPFAQQDNQLEQGWRQQQGRQSGPGSEAHPQNDYPSAHVIGGLHSTLGPISLGREGGLLQQNYLNWQGQQSARYWPEQTSSRRGPWKSEFPSQGLRLTQNMYSAGDQDQVSLGNDPVPQLRRTGPYWSEQQEFRDGLRSQGHPAPGTQACRGMYGIGGVIPVTPPHQIIPRMEAEQQNVPMPHMQSTQHNQQSRPGLPAQQGPGVPGRRKKLEKWECPTC